MKITHNFLLETYAVLDKNGRRIGDGFHTVPEVRRSASTCDALSCAKWKSGDRP